MSAIINTAAPKMVRPKAPTQSSLDLPLTSVLQSKDGNFWWVGEMKTRVGGVCKCWKLFRFDAWSREEVEAMPTEQLQKIASGFLAENRERIIAEDPTLDEKSFLTVEQDTEEIAKIKAMGKLPSVEYQRVKDARAKKAKQEKAAANGGVIKSMKKSPKMAKASKGVRDVFEKVAAAAQERAIKLAAVEAAKSAVEAEFFTEN